MKSSLKWTALAVATVSLAGCKGNPLHSAFDRGYVSAKVANAQVESGSRVIQEASMNLRQGNISAAVANFQIAAMDPDSAAAAYNGLAVSYARLGRDDLALRYFQTAARLEPANPRFTANLFRLQKKQMLARQQALMPRALARLEEASPQLEQSRSARAPLYVRSSKSEIRISTRNTLGKAPTMTVAYREKAEPASAEAAPEIEVASTDDTEVKDKATSRVVAWTNFSTLATSRGPSRK